MRSLAILAASTALIASAAQPPLNHHGRLLTTSDQPVEGVVTVLFELFDGADGGQALWSEEQSIDVASGHYATLLGVQTPFPEALFAGEARWLQLTIDGSALKPRQRIGSVPYALVARHLTGGKVDATELTVGGRLIVDSAGELADEVADAFARASHTHAANELTSGTLALARLPHGTGSGLDADLLDGLDSNVFARADRLAQAGTLNAADNPVDWTALKNVPAELLGGDDEGLRAVAHDDTLLGDGAQSPLRIDPAKVQRRVTGTCAEGFVLRAILETGAVECVRDANSGGTVTKVNAAAPLVVTDGATPTVSLAGCASGQLLKWNGTAWACAADTDTNTTYTPGDGLRLAGSVLALTNACTSNQLLKWNGNAWACASDANSGGTVTRVNVTAPLVVTNGTTTPGVSLAPCAGDEVLRFEASSSAWKCAPQYDRAPTLRTFPQTVELGTVKDTAAQVVTVFNAGDRTATGITITAPAGFTASTSGCSELAALASCAVRLELVADGNAGARTGKLLVRAQNAAPLDVPVSASYEPLGSQAHPARSCLAIKEARPGAQDGVYWLDIDGAGPHRSAHRAYCDMTLDGGGWTLLMKMAAGTRFSFDSQYWTSSGGYASGTALDMTFNDERVQAYAELPIDELNLRSQGGNRTTLRLGTPGTTLLQAMNGGTQLLHHVGGSATPLLLVNGNNTTTCGHVWRLNTQNSGLGIRIGGWHVKDWDCTYGNDGAGKPTSPEGVGFGLMDTQWTPLVYAKKSFGVRQAHDRTSMPGGGQFSTGAMIFGR